MINMEELKQRHGCVTFWLWLVVLVNLGLAFFYCVEMFDVWHSGFVLGYGLLSILGTINVLSAILLMRWNRLGFYMLLTSSIIALIVNIGILGLPYSSALSALIAALIWWAILQIRKNGVSAWSLMNSGWDYKHCRHLYQVFVGIIIFILILTIVASMGNGQKSDIDKGEVPELKVEEPKAEEPKVEDEPIPSDGIEWKVFEDKTRFVSIEAPNDFRRLNLTEDQLMSLGCSDFDPCIVILQEEISSLKTLNVTTVQEYTQIKLKMLQNSGGTDFKKLLQKPYGDGNSSLIEFEMKIEGDKFYYKCLITKTDRYFYYCQILCLDQYRQKLEGQMDHMVKSFKTYK